MPLHIEQLELHIAQQSLFRNLNWKISAGEHWHIGGESGSGKSSLLKAIMGELPHTGKIYRTEKTVFLAHWYDFKDRDGDRNFYYQQRYHNFAQEKILSIQQDLVRYGEAENLDPRDLQVWIERLELEAHLTKSLMSLSNGEHKKLQWLKALWKNPDLMLLDQPFNGLDVESTEKFCQLIDELAKLQNIQFVIVGSGATLPSCINRFAVLEHGVLNMSPAGILSKAAAHPKALPDFLKTDADYTGEVVRMEQLQIAYNGKQVLKNINWQVQSGEKWLITGRNGSGKSTLISLITADHPQAYNQEFYLFGQKRGSGESIWDIKKKIGFISPELHRYFKADTKVWQVLASGFFDSVGLYRDLGTHKQQKIEQLLEFLELRAAQNKPWNSLALGMQRMVLLARSWIKNPQVLILDEPCLGLDEPQIMQFNALIDHWANAHNTLIYIGHVPGQYPKVIDKELILREGEIINHKQTETKTHEKKDFSYSR